MRSVLILLLLLSLVACELDMGGFGFGFGPEESEEADPYGTYQEPFIVEFEYGLSGRAHCRLTRLPIDSGACSRTSRPPPPAIDARSCLYS